VKTNRLTTKSEVNTIDCTWEVSNFADQVSKVLHGCNSGTYWHLKMMLNDDGWLRIGVIECYNTPYGIIHVDSKLQISLSLRLSVFEKKMPHCFNVVGRSLYWKLIKWKVVVGNPERYLAGGKLTVFCSLHWLEVDTETYVADQLNVPPLPVVPQSASVPWIRNVLCKGLFTDVVVVAGEREFTAHRAILAERSEVFRAMFDADMLEKHNGRIVIEDLSSDAVSEMLSFIYTDSVDDIGKTASELLASAEKYNIPRLKAVCELELATSISIDNAVDIFVQSEMYRASQLKEAALYWIARHAHEVVKTPAWKSFTNKGSSRTGGSCLQTIGRLHWTTCGIRDDGC